MTAASSAAEAFARPFLDHGSPPDVDDARDAGRHDDTTPDDPAMVRAYTITGGRTRTDAPHLRFESMVGRRGEPGPDGRAFEHREIIDLLDEPLSVAEISARIAVPIGVARVLVGDLLTDGSLELFDTPTDIALDISLVRELIDGIRNL